MFPRGPEVDRFVHGSRGGCWYFYHYLSNSAHQTEDMPATVNVRRALLEVSSGDIVWLGGSLIATHSIGRAAFLARRRVSLDKLLA
jgi:hypothetical protein